MTDHPLDALINQLRSGYRHEVDVLPIQASEAIAGDLIIQDVGWNLPAVVVERITNYWYNERLWLRVHYREQLTDYRSETLWAPEEMLLLVHRFLGPTPHRVDSPEDGSTSEGVGVES